MMSCVSAQGAAMPAQVSPDAGCGQSMLRQIQARQPDDLLSSVPSKSSGDSRLDGTAIRTNAVNFNHMALRSEAGFFDDVGEFI